jgi:ATP-dependent DNA helicase RecG
MIWNYGQLPENWTIEKLQEKHSSVPHNPDISNAFFRIGYIEAWGRGIKKINEQCAEAGLPNPLFYCECSGVWVVFRKDTLNEQSLKELGLNDRQVKAVLYVKEKGKITNSEYQKINETTAKTAFRDLEELLNKNMFRQKGENKGTYYELENVRYVR